MKLYMYDVVPMHVVSIAYQVEMLLLIITYSPTITA